MANLTPAFEAALKECLDFNKKKRPYYFRQATMLKLEKLDFVMREELHAVHDGSDDCLEAADEIERLQQKLKTIADLLDEGAYGASGCIWNADAIARVEEHREAA